MLLESLKVKKVFKVLLKVLLLVKCIKVIPNKRNQDFTQLKNSLFGATNQITICVIHKTSQHVLSISHIINIQ